MYTSWQDSQTSPPMSDPATGCIRRWWSGRLPRKPPWGSYRPSGRQRWPWRSWELSQSSARSPPMSLKTWNSKRLQQQMISEMCFLYFMFSFFSSLNAHSPMAENTSWIPNRYPQYIMYIVVLYAMLRQHRRKVFTSPSHNGVSYML